MSSPEIHEKLEQLLPIFRRAAVRAAVVHRQRQRLYKLAAASVAVIALASSAVAASIIPGSPAPPRVKRSFATIDRAFLNAGIRASRAEVVAVDGTAVLYGAEARSGAYCTILSVPRLRPSRVGCEPGVFPNSLTVEGTKQVISQSLGQPFFVLSGRLSSRGRTLEARFGDGSTKQIRTGLRGFFIYKPSPPRQAQLEVGGLALVERSGSGTVISRTPILPPIALTTRGHPPREIQGRVRISGARYVDVVVFAIHGKVAGQNGSDRLIRLDREGRFSFQAPSTAGHRYLIRLSVLDKSFAHVLDDVPVG